MYITYFNKEDEKRENLAAPAHASFFSSFLSPSSPQNSIQEKIHPIP